MLNKIWRHVLFPLLSLPFSRTPPPPISHSWKGTGFPIRQFLLNPFKCVRENNHSKMCKRCLQNYVYRVTGKTGIGDNMKSLNQIEWHFLVWYWGARLNKCPNSVCTSSHPHPHPAWSMTLLYEPGMEPPNLLQLHFPLDTILTSCPQYPLQLLMPLDIHQSPGRFWQMTWYEPAFLAMWVCFWVVLCGVRGTFVLCVRPMCCQRAESSPLI